MSTQAGLLGKKKRNRSPVEKGTAFLRLREEKVDLTSGLGRTIMVTTSTDKRNSGGYFCEVCQCTLKDSVAWLDHINGERHQAKQGMSMKVEAASLDSVKAKLAKLSQQNKPKKELNSEKLEDTKSETNSNKKEKEKENGRTVSPIRILVDDEDQELSEYENEEDNIDDIKKRKRRRLNPEDEDDDDLDININRKKENNDTVHVKKDENENALNYGDVGKGKQTSSKKNEVKTADQLVDEELMLMMGFPTGFKSNKK
ncbi:MAG: putative Zinc finger matrin-type protein [Streblomastix strix]|uniref:Putative Zinc finger matrin-type protein n=1 Tax=Streblomastix strix TaxID=222440 RepID=A0A5J4WRA3_9EUKA|nr:MAG: putative Zinc finger matrin-type protein [Streblomastix strix]